MTTKSIFLLHLDTEKFSVCYGKKLDEQSNCLKADWHLESISLYFWNITFVVVPCCKLSNVFLIKGKRFRLFGLNVQKTRRTCLFYFTFSERRTSKGIIDTFFIPFVTISLGYF